MTDVAASADASAKSKKIIVLVESDAPSAKTVAEIVASFPGYTLQAYPDFASFQKWLETPADQRGDVKLLLWSTEALGAETPATLRARAATAGLSPEIPLILTTFETPDLALAKWMTAGAFNLLIKPVDQLLLKQNFQVALADKDLSAESAVYQMQTQARVESLKAVQMTDLSEVGFITRSDRAIPEGRPAKYYGAVFSHNEVRSLYARMFDQVVDGNAWKVRFTFFGPSRDQMLRIRSHFPKTPGRNEPWIAKAAPSPKVRFMIIADPSPTGSELSATLIRNFPNVEVVPLSRTPDEKFGERTFDAIFVHRDFLATIQKDDRFKDIKKIAITERALTEEELRSVTAAAVDIVYTPMERISFYKKLQVLFPTLKPSEERPIQTYEWKENLNVGQPVEVTEISEAALTERYERAFEPGTVRKFILWYPIEKDMPVLTGRCYKSEKDPAHPGAFMNSFIFFGISDRETKQIRLWIRDHYIMGKQGS